LSPSNTALNSFDNQLIGDLISYQGIKDYSSDYIFFPSSPITHARVLDYLQNAMLIPRSEVTLTGLECDKIGVAYHAFKYQSEGCNKHAGDCLRNQLEDYHTSNAYFATNEGELAMLNDAITNQIFFSVVFPLMISALL
jgi:hypothetical protein